MLRTSWQCVFHTWFILQLNDYLIKRDFNFLMTFFMIDLQTVLLAIIGNYMSPRKPTITKEEKNKLVRMSFDVSEDLRNDFKAKLAKRGKTAREAIVEFMKEYIKKH